MLGEVTSIPLVHGDLPLTPPARSLLEAGISGVRVGWQVVQPRAGAAAYLNRVDMRRIVPVRSAACCIYLGMLIAQSDPVDSWHPSAHRVARDWGACGPPVTPPTRL
jgi:hypothetical protein